MKAKLLRDAGDIPKGAEVEIVSKVADGGEGAAGGAPVEAAADAPVYAVKDEDDREEKVDTRDLKPSP
jgi:hypothetical protein